MLTILKLGAGYRTYLIALLILLQAATKLVLGDYGGALDLFTSHEMTQALEGLGLATFRAALPRDLTGVLEQLVRRSGIRAGAALLALGFAMAPLHGCAWMGDRYDTACLTSCGERCVRQCELECRHSQGGTGESGPVPDHSPSLPARAASSAVSSPSQ